MAGSTRAESTSSNLDGSSFAASYPSGQRGSYSGTGLDRSGSFRESLENRVMVSGASMPRNASPSLELTSLTQYLTLEPVSMSEQQYTRAGELRRVLGISLEEHSFGSMQSKTLPPIASEELKRFKASIQESCNKARDRAKQFHEYMLKVDKCRNHSRKRQRSDIVPSEKSGGSNLLKMGSQMHQNSSDFVGQRLEDRAKSVVPNKRARSSMAEVRSEGRASVPSRQGNLTDKDKGVQMEKDKATLRTCNGVTNPIEDKIRSLPAGGDGWDKKMKRKRSVGTMVSRIPEGDREFKPVIQQRPNNESHARTGDALGFRSGSSTGIIGNNKLDGNTQLTAVSSRITPRVDLDAASLANERRDRSAVLDKERSTSKGSTKLNMREDIQVGSQSPLTKGKASRQPRTGSSAMMNSSSNFPRPLGGVDGWEQPSGLSRVQPLPGATNRKRPLPTGSSSPPVAQWVGQRPQKISRTRRQNVVSPVSNFDESQSLSEGYPAPDAGPRLPSTEPAGFLLHKGMPNSSHQLKLKLENVPSPAGFSESEESVSIENKSKEKEADNGEVEDGVLNPVHKVASFVLPTKKNKISLKEEIGDGVRRQGRSGRSSMQQKACLPLAKEKLENTDVEKPVKIGRPGSDKSESRVGRPPSKKGSDRKAAIRSVLVMNNGSSELTGESEDDREDLLAAANAARNANYVACSGPFWKKMDPFFALINTEDVNHLKLQINFAEELDESLHSVLDAEDNVKGELARRAAPSPHSSLSVEKYSSQTIMVGPNKSSENLQLFDGARPVQMVSGKLETESWLEKMVPLSQRLLSAFIAEDEIENADENVEEGDIFLHSSSDDSPYCTSSIVEDEHKEADPVKSEFKLEVDFNHQKRRSRDNFPCNGYSASSNFRSSSIQTMLFDDELLHENVLVHADSGSFCELGRSNSDPQQTLGTGFCGISPSDCQYEHMSLDERITMELNSIGLYPEIVFEAHSLKNLKETLAYKTEGGTNRKRPDLAEGGDEEIEKDIVELKRRLYQQVGKKKAQLDKLERALVDEKEIEERNLEQLAMNKLVEMAYKKLMGGRGSHSHKSGASKISKQLATAFAKRTLVRCQKFEETGQSCFSEPPLRDAILQTSDAKYLDGINAVPNAEPHSCPPGSRTTAFGMVDINGNSHKLDRGLSDPFQSLAQMSDQTSVKPGKKKEVLLDDVTHAASRATSTLTHAIPGGAKGKRSERDRDQNKETSARNSVLKAGRPSLSNGRGERKTKTKPKQKLAQISTSGNGLLSRVTETANGVLPSRQESCGTVSSSTKINQEVGNSGQDSSKEIEENIFTSLPLHVDSIEELDVADGLGGQGQDLGSWLNVDEDMLQDHDLVGLEIPMDDLSELKLNF